MKKTRHKFPLKAVLTIRERQEERARQTYAASAQMAEAARRRLEDVRGEINGAADEFQRRVTAGCTISELRHIEQHCEHLRVRRMECERGLLRAQQTAQETLAVWLGVRRSREVLDEHISKLLRRLDARARRKEQKTLDDLAATRKVWCTRQEKHV